jgi:hypothetical protein
MALKMEGRRGEKIPFSKFLMVEEWGGCFID